MLLMLCDYERVNAVALASSILEFTGQKVLPVEVKGEMPQVVQFIEVPCHPPTCSTIRLTEEDRGSLVRLTNGELQAELNRRYRDCELAALRG